MKKYLFMALAAFALCGCGDSSITIDETTDNTTDDTHHDEEFLDTGLSPSSHFITDYCVPSEIKVNNINGTLNLVIKGESFGSFREEGKEFAEFYGDTSYKGSTFPGMSSSLAYPIDKITITCDADFDAEHPSGEPLDNIVKLEFHSYYEYIRNGYKFPEGTSSYYLLNFCDIDAKVATLVKLKPFVLHLVNVTPLIYFASQPETPGEYTFTLEMIINGETFKTEFSYTFE